MNRAQKIEQLYKFFESEMPSIVRQIRDVIEDGGDLIALSVVKEREGRRVVQKVKLLRDKAANQAPYQEEVGPSRSYDTQGVEEKARRVAQSLVLTTIDVLQDEARTSGLGEHKSWYYDLEPGTPLREVFYRWIEDGQKVYDHSLPAYYPLHELLRYREYKWSRYEGAHGPGKARHMSWDALKQSIKQNGWDPENPVHLVVGKNGNAKIGEGNHRLGAALELEDEGVDVGDVPVWIHFNTRVSSEEGKAHWVSRFRVPYR
jgi:hypothetical protein